MIPVRNRALFVLGALLVFAGVADSQVYFGGYPSQPTFSKISLRTPSTGTFTATWAGVTPTTSGAVSYQVVGNVVTLTIPQASFTGTATTWTFTGMPVAIQPATSKNFPLSPFTVENGGAFLTTGNVDVQIGNTGTVTFFLSGSSGGWAATAARALGFNENVTYTLN